ncbi:MAG TPA: TetR family transcriptional regulator [Solirubrobacterales bacterium]
MSAEARSTTARKRADAQRNIAAILDAAVEVLAARPDASVGEIARHAGVARQTVYAHYASREALLEAVAERALREAVEAIDGVRPGDGDPREALERLVLAWWRTVARNARVLDALAVVVGASGPDLRAFHAPILERLARFARRGQRAGAFNRDVPADWLAVSFLALMHAAADEVAAGRMRPEQAEDALQRSVRACFAG